MTDKTFVENLKSNRSYKDFTFFNEPVNFAEYFKDKAYDVVQIHDTTPVGGGIDIVGFAGTFSWSGNTLNSLDGDSYTLDMPVVGFSEFTKEGKHCLDILTPEW